MPTAHVCPILPVHTPRPARNLGSAWHSAWALILIIDIMPVALVRFLAWIWTLLACILMVSPASLMFQIASTWHSLDFWHTCHHTHAITHMPSFQLQHVPTSTECNATDKYDCTENDLFKNRNSQELIAQLKDNIRISLHHKGWNHSTHVSDAACNT